jgi:hypothetical protein
MVLWLAGLGDMTRRTRLIGTGSAFSGLGLLALALALV